MAKPFAPTFASRLRRHDTVLGTVVTLPSMALAELTAEALDFVWFDLEHGGLDCGDVQPLAVVARAARCAAIVRLPSPDDFRLPAILDAGVDGVAAPRVESADEARNLVKRMRHPPRGVRGYAARRSDGYGRIVGSASASALVLMAQIETAAGVREAAAIANVEGVDALVVGCADLALALDGRLAARSGAMRDAVARVQAAAANAGIPSGIAGPDDPGVLRELAGGRSTVLVCSADVRTYARAAGDQAAALRRAVAAPATDKGAAHVTP